MTKLTVNDIRVELTTTPKEKTPDDKLGFGTVFTDHMFVMDWSSDKGWYDPRIVPYGPIPMSPALNVLHYGQSIFEGMKAYMANGEPVLFRPEQNFRRLNKSADRIALPELDEEFALAALKKLISIDKDIEEELHSKYSKNNITGEWFKFNKEEIQEVLKDFKQTTSKSNY
mgnify:CR=1 FL=1